MCHRGHGIFAFDANILSLSLSAACRSTRQPIFESEPSKASLRRPDPSHALAADLGAAAPQFTSGLVWALAPPAMGAGAVVRVKAEGASPEGGVEGYTIGPLTTSG